MKWLKTESPNLEHVFKANCFKIKKVSIRKCLSIKPYCIEKPKTILYPGIIKDGLKLFFELTGGVDLHTVYKYP